MKPADLVRKVILAEMVTLYRSPSQVQNADQGAVYQTAIIETLAQFNPTEPELRTMWERFKRTWTKTTWPTPGDLCQALSAVQLRTRRPKNTELPAPAINEPLTDVERVELEATIEAIPDGPLKATLIRAGNAILERA